MTLDHATTERGSVERISPRTSERKKANRERGRSRTAQVFLDSGCLTGSYIREEVARRLANTRSNFFTPQITKVCGAFGGCELSTRIITVEIEFLNEDVTKKFETKLKVVKRLPYEIMIGRQDMLAHELSIKIGQSYGKVHHQEIPTEDERPNEREEIWESQNNGEERDTRDTRDIRDTRDFRDIRDPRDIRDTRDTRDIRTTRDTQNVHPDTRNTHHEPTETTGNIRHHVVKTSLKHEGAKDTQQRHVTWADQHSHPATNSPLKDEGFPRPRLDIEKRSSSALASLEKYGVDKVLIKSLPQPQEEQLTLVTFANSNILSRTPVPERTTEERLMRELIREETRQTTSLPENSNKNTHPCPRKTLEEFLYLVRDVKAKAERRKESKFSRNKGRRKLAAVRSTRRRDGTNRQDQEGVAIPLTFRAALRKGKQLYRLLTDVAGRDVLGFGTPIVSSRLIPVPFTHRHLIAAAMCLEKEVANGMALALEVPVDVSSAMTDHNGEPVPDEHLNLVRDYQVELHSKLVESEENRNHMTSYIHFEEDALGDDEILGETDMDYFIEPKDSYLADSKQLAGREDKEIHQTHKPQPHEANNSVTPETNSTRGNRKHETLSEHLEHHESLAEHHEAHETLADHLEHLADPKSPKQPRPLGDRDKMRTPNGNEGTTSYIPPDIRGDDVIMKDGRRLSEHLKEVCLNVKPVFNTKVRSTPALVTPMRLEVQDHLWEDPSNALGPRLHTPLKQAEVAKQVNKMKPLGIIKDSQAPYYSQVHLTPNQHLGNGGSASMTDA
jgi:hypothetical protein